jgi:hypothetical protein
MRRCAFLSDELRASGLEEARSAVLVRRLAKRWCPGTLPEEGGTERRTEGGTAWKPLRIKIPENYSGRVRWRVFSVFKVTIYCEGDSVLLEMLGQALIHLLAES